MTEVNWGELLAQAWQNREPIISGSQTDSWRVFHGYSEGFPGVSIEKFADDAVVDFKQDVRPQLPEISRQLLAHFPFQRIIAKGNQCLQLRLRDRVFPLHGDYSEDVSFAHEHEVRYSLHAYAAHNIGLYLDARPVRRWLLNNSEQQRVLNLFSFTGSLGLAAAMGRARSVTHLDKSTELLPRIKQSYQANGLNFDRRDFVLGDIYRHLPRAIKSGQRFDGIILDPPPQIYHSRFAREKPSGQDFGQLVKMCAKLLNEGGWLLAMYHRFDANRESYDQDIVHASQNTLYVTEGYTSDIDFPEQDPNRKLRVSIFKKNK